MRYFRIAALSVAVLGLLVAPAALADCNENHAEATAAADEGDCCAKKAAAVEGAKTGCSKSTAKLIAMAKESGCSKTEAMAAKAEEGDKEALEALIVKYDTTATAAEHHSAEAVQLATNAKNGCSKSEAQLIAKAKESGCPKSHDLASRAEKGDDEARAELIAMYSGDHSEE